MKHITLIIFILGFTLSLFAQSNADTLIPCRKGNKWGYMNISGELVIKTKYDEAYPFENNRGRVKMNGKYGFINKKGEVKIDLKYEHVADFINGVAILSVGIFYLDTLGNEQLVKVGCGGSYLGMEDYRVFEKKWAKGSCKNIPY